ncbi:tryptophan 2,3-dioxygenase family protein [Kitasatospora sp. NBC_00240]|uniref:tryptophan 2,3-dioxygenase n=1 Tax=Kitasatospora sp. NBC_00240 TaxID=2903567 RepID=UPI0022542BA3|nr:tryptophan 2,3-dioxygenase family protein [Kitasatospora sp. NBC_00240]MCX5214389.1 tryptophan 2,3-dioxygenase family protein [Kitasatospora sp. NBC_00240]
MSQHDRAVADPQDDAGPTDDGPTDDGPTTEFEGATPYDDYVHASVLTSLQQPLTNDPGEMAFLVTTQVMELWFTLIVHEWDAARDALLKDDFDRAMDALRRSLDAHQALNDSWRPIAALTPGQFNGFRAAFGNASGFQSAMYRRMEFLLGDKSRSMVRPHRGHPRVHAELEESLTRPSLYDVVLGYLHRRGLPVPEQVLHRDVTVAYEADTAVEETWRQIYAGSPYDPLVALGEALTDVAEAVLRWRSDHLLVTRRAMGSKTGSGGSPGVAWLEKRAVRSVFPEIWTARSHV